jgi:hypothetical protein
VKRRFLVGAIAAVFVLTGCSSGQTGESLGGADFPLSISEMPENAARWGTLCQPVVGSGWHCVVDISLVNNSQEPWNGFLTANLIAEDGSVSSATNSPDNPDLLGSFSQTANPGNKWEWMAYFPVGEGKRFTKLVVLENNSEVGSFPICIGSTMEDALGC